MLMSADETVKSGLSGIFINILNYLY